MGAAVQEMFSAIAERYDRANDVLSFGAHRVWRRQAVQFAGAAPGESVLDVCTGTGDLAFAFARAVGASGTVAGVDFVPNMIKLAVDKRSQFGPADARSEVSFAVGDALQLPFEDQMFDIVSVAFGIRNVDDVDRCLREMHRVLRPGGRVLVVEFGRPTLPGFSALYRWYSREVLPRIGGALTGNREAYEYLPRTSRVFPDGADFQKLMADAGFSDLRLRRFFSGVAYAYLGVRNPLSIGVDLEGGRDGGQAEEEGHV
ncbi:MAG: bifunctional demethylmenaquinone methyltransferase/2-methoxy-6-polyprenyl-1,4-benzoquinol methylase UbiE [Bdellovibrionales bacterium]|nr:bifunctional demethylmenaquinone methyltransferase/2-methoxy-6-polyprenyl-1,4-benzoquinol methylase UbiE [Bdellovibrionales bacterium]